MPPPAFHLKSSTSMTLYCWPTRAYSWLVRFIHPQKRPFEDIRAIPTSAIVSDCRFWRVIVSFSLGGEDCVVKLFGHPIYSHSGFPIYKRLFKALQTNSMLSDIFIIGGCKVIMDLKW